MQQKYVFYKFKLKICFLAILYQFPIFDLLFIFLNREILNELLIKRKLNFCVKLGHVFIFLKEI